MLCYGFLSVFQKIGPKGWVLICLILGLSFGSKSGKPRFWLPCSSEWFHTRVTTFVFRAPLKRRNVGSSVACKLSGMYVCRRTLERRDLRSSEELCLTLERASSEDFQHPVLLHFYRPLERGSLCSSGESHARARPLFSANFEKCFKVHFCILILS